MKALVAIDFQNDYFTGGNFPLWNPDAALQTAERAIYRATAAGVPVILVRHAAGPVGVAPFFHEGTPGADLHPRIVAAAPAAPVVKGFADAFEKAALDGLLAERGVEDVLLCGMMTHNCDTHTALSKSADRYSVSVLTDCCTTVSKILHHIALNALSTRVRLTPSTEAV